MEGGSGVNRIIIDVVYSWDIQGDQMEAESCGTPSIIDGPHSPGMQPD